MSTRSKKTTTTTMTRESSSAASSPSPSGSGSASTSFRSPGRHRPPSPTTVSRHQEKEVLAGLNDRLAAYIDRVKRLETDNSRLTRQVQSTEEVVHREVTNIKALYEKELADARKLVDDTARDKAKLQLEVSKLRADSDELKEKYAVASRDLTITQKKLLSAESQVNDLQARLNDAVAQRRHWEDEYNKLKKDYDAVVKQLAAAKKQLEDEMVSRVDLENRVQSLKEELSFKNQIHEQELNETVSRTRVEIEEVDGQIQHEYDSRLKDALQDMRSENDELIRITRVETEEIFQKKLADMRKLTEGQDFANNRSQEEIMTLRKRFNDLSSELTKLRSQNAAYEARIQDLEGQLARITDDHNAMQSASDAEVRRLRDALEDQMSEYRDLLDIKIQLDTEITAYRKLLETEETRLNISTSSESTPMKRRGTPTRGTPVSRKRKRMDLGESYSGLGQLHQSSSSSGFSSTSSAKGVVEVYEIDTDGKYIKLFNGSDKDQPIGSWILKLTAGDDQETTYKFHRSCNVKAGQYVTVWSAESDQTHSPPHDLVMKSQKWFTADKMAAILSNTQHEDMASREMTRTMLRQTTTMSSSRSDRDDTPPTNGQRAWFWWN